MKKCSFCGQMLQESAHHCHHCNATLIDMDGNKLGNIPIEPPPRQQEILEISIKVLITIFFTVDFFILGIVMLRTVFGISIMAMNSAGTILANVILLMASVAGALVLSPLIIKWVKVKMEQV